MDYSDEIREMLNMTNKEAAEIIRNLVNSVHSGRGRGNGKTHGMLRNYIALWKAADILSKIPDDVPISKEVEEVKRGLRASMKIVDESAAVVVGENVTFSPGKLDPSCYGKYDRVMMERQLRDEEAYQNFMKLSGLDELVKRQHDEFNKIFITTSSPYNRLKNYTSRFELADPEPPWEKMEWKQESEKLSKEIELLDDTSIYQGINESHHDYCIRLSKILGMATDTSEEDAIDRVEAFFKVFNEIPRVNAYSPEDIKAGLEKERQNGGDLL